MPKEDPKKEDEVDSEPSKPVDVKDILTESKNEDVLELSPKVAANAIFVLS